ncbi:MAG: tetratricopeptide repeat protein [Clostridium sp.]|nr:tetratricopeptide repeat protein [Clostridium sp.]
MNRILILCLGLCLLASCRTGRTVETLAERGRVLPDRRLTPEEQRRFDYYYLEALNQKQMERHDAAYDLYRHCLELQPDAGEVVYELAVYALLLGRNDEAEQHLIRATELEPENVWYKETLASYYINRREMAKAIPVLEDLSELSPSRTDVLAQLVSMYMSVDNREEAVRVLNRIEVLDGKDAQVSLEKYRLYMQDGLEEKALAELESLAQAFPNDLTYRVLIGNSYLQSGNPEKALGIYREVMAREPDNRTLQISMLDYYKEIKDESSYTAYMDSLLYDSRTEPAMRLHLMRDWIAGKESAGADSTEVLAVFDRLLSTPQDGIEILALCAAYMELKKMPADSVAGMMNRILEVEPDNETALLRLLQYHIQHEQFSEAADICRRGVHYYPDHLPFYFYLGFSYYQSDRKKEALEAFAQGARQVKEDTEPTIVSDLYSVMGDLLHDSGRKAEAYAAYDSCLVYRDDNVSCLNNYAYFLSVDNEQLDRAEEMSYRTIKMDPDNKVYLDTYAWILFKKGRYTEARVYIDRVMEGEGDVVESKEGESASADVTEHAGDIYFMCGDVDKALYYWRLAEEKGSTSTVLKKKIKQKKYLK